MDFFISWHVHSIIEPFHDLQLFWVKLFLESGDEAVELVDVDGGLQVDHLLVVPEVCKVAVIAKIQDTSNVRPPVAASFCLVHDLLRAVQRGLHVEQHLHFLKSWRELIFDLFDVFEFGFQGIFSERILISIVLIHGRTGGCGSRLDRYPVLQAVERIATGRELEVDPSWVLIILMVRVLTGCHHVRIQRRIDLVIVLHLSHLQPTLGHCAVLVNVRKHRHVNSLFSSIRVVDGSYCKVHDVSVPWVFDEVKREISPDFICGGLRLTVILHALLSLYSPVFLREHVRIDVLSVEYTFLGASGEVLVLLVERLR
jgi:hypothetical protein